MVILKQKKLKGFTLVEAVVSMIIIMVCFSISTMVYLNVVKSDNISSKTKAFLEVKHIASSTFQNHEFFDQTFESDNLTVTRHIEPYQNNPKLKLIIITATNQKGKVLYTFKQITTEK